MFAPLPRDALTLAKQREAQGPLGAAALKELGRNAAALIAGRPDATDAEYERVRSRRRRRLSPRHPLFGSALTLRVRVACARRCAHTSRSWTGT